jgi:hypothetical protein
MATLAEIRQRCQIVLISPTGTQYQVERLEGRPGDYRRGYRLTETGGPDERPAFAHELPNGVQECSCTAWTQARECEHVALLVGAGLFDEPRRLGPADEFAEDELVDIDWEAGAP